jgi:glycine amidinotransferase
VEFQAYRRLFKEYHKGGARWLAAPKPSLDDELYVQDFTVPKDHEPMRYVLTEHEPVFDAADFVRCGKDIFVTRSNVTNESGIRWLERHLGHTYRIHRLESKCRQPMHIDSTFMPMAPGKVMINPDFIDVETLPKILKKWDVLVAPRPDKSKGPLVSMCSAWLSMNFLMIDEKRIIVEQQQKTLIRQLKDWGFEPLPIPFVNFAPFGGAFHCATLDVRRKGKLQSYFD